MQGNAEREKRKLEVSHSPTSNYTTNTQKSNWYDIDRLMDTHSNGAELRSQNKTPATDFPQRSEEGTMEKRKPL